MQTDTMDLYEVRRRNLAEHLHKRGHGIKQKLAFDLGMTPPQISHWLKKPGTTGARKIHEDHARRLEAALGLMTGALDQSPERVKSKLDADENMMLAAMTAVARVVMETGIKVDEQQILLWAKTVYVDAKAAGHIDESFVRRLVRDVT